MSNRLRAIHSRGVTLVELIVTITLIGVLATLAGPPVQRMRDRAALQNGRHMVTSALSLAAATGTKWGRGVVVGLDTADGTLRVVVDTGEAGTGADTLLVREYRLGTDLRVHLGSNRTAFCYDSRGVGSTAARCPYSGGWISLRHGFERDTIVVSSVGRVRR